MPRTKKIVKLINEKRRAREHKLAQEIKETLKQELQFNKSSSLTSDTSTSLHSDTNAYKATNQGVKGGTQPKGNKIKLSSLQLKMQRKLSGAQFRLINEQLYTIKSGEALQLMQDKPSLFSVVSQSEIKQFQPLIFAISTFNPSSSSLYIFLYI